MANLKITALTTQSTLLDTDVFVVVDTTDNSMAPSGTDKQITAANVIDGVKTALVTIPDTRIPFGDASSDLTTDANLTYASSTITTPNVLVKTALKLEETGVGTDTITVQSPSSIASSYTLTLPTAVGTTGQALTLADNAGTLTFSTNGAGDVVGPASSTDNAVARFDSTTGKLLQDSVVIVSDVGAVTGVTVLDVDNIRTDLNTISSTNVNGNINLEPNGTGVTTSTKAIKSQTGFIFEDTGVGTNTVTVQAPSGLASSYSLTLPPDAGTVNYFLQAAGAGVTQWAAATGGDVVGPASATDNVIAVYDGTTGKLIKNSTITVNGANLQVGATPGTNSVSLGASASSAGNGSVALGTGATTAGTAAVAVGDGALAAGAGGVSVGNDASASAATAIAVGSQAVGSASNGIAIGNSSRAAAADAIAVGREAMAVAGGSVGTVAIGLNSLNALTSTGTNNVAVGQGTGQLLTTGDQNVIVGANAGDSSGVDVSNIVAVGYNALGAALTIAADGAVGIGSQALLNLTTGGNNVAIGQNAGAAITGGADNTLVGALVKSAASASNNTIIGSQAGTTALSDNNVAIGASALASADAAAYQIVIGQNAMGLGGVTGGTATTGNIAVGSGSLLNLSTGTSNICIGGHTGIGFTTAANNVLIGNGAGDGAAAATAQVVAIGTDAAGAGVTVAANGAVAIGYLAGNALTSGAHNTLVGYNGGSTVATTTGSNNTIVGYAAVSAATVSNNTIVGNQASASTIGGATVIGSSAVVSATDGVALGRAATVTTGTGNIAIGTSSQATGGTTAAIAIGNGTVASAQGAIALGTGVTNAVVNSLFLPTTLATTTGTAVVFNASGQIGPDSSSIRFKEDVKDARDLTGAIDKIRVVDYIRKDSGTRQLGLIAEELFEIYPEFVPLDMEGKPFSVDYARLTLALIQEVQNLRKEINVLKK